MKLLANKVHVQGMTVLLADKVHEKNHNVNGYIFCTVYIFIFLHSIFIFLYSILYFVQYFLQKHNKKFQKISHYMIEFHDI